MATSVLVVRELDKAFGSTLALSGIELDLGAGQVHAVIGENGAGKSTLMKILAGVEHADSGIITLAGQRFAPDNPDQARRQGVAIVPQEPELAIHLSVGENVVLGAEPTRWGFVDRTELRRRAEKALSLVAHGADVIDPGRPAFSLSAGDRQRVVIARALCVAEPRLLILDEPTSSLTAADAEQLFSIVERLKQEGLLILHVSHFLEEVMAVADSFTVLRDGKVSGSGAIADTSVDALVAMMAGRDVARRKRSEVRSIADEVVISAEELAGSGALPKRASFELHRGEVLGIAGLVGAGRSELLRTIFGLHRVESGQLRVGAYLGPASPVRRLAQGVGLLSEDRKGEGLALQLSIAENLVMSRRHTRGPFVDSTRERNAARRFIEQLGIACRGGQQPVGQLSGGNQQKVALARLLHHDVDILLLDEPTRGIDVNSRADVHAAIEAQAARGKSVLLVSSYLPELLELCDRIAVMSRGRLGKAHIVSDVDEQKLLKEASGA